MPLFNFGKQNTEADDHAKLNTQRLEQGGLTIESEKRLSELRDKSGFFTSSLSVNEFVLATSDNIRPLGQVMGSTIYHVGWQYTPMYSSTELVMLTHAQTHARLLAIARLQQEARLLGAHGVVGVRLERTAYEWGANLLEFTARGTAVALSNTPIPEHPFVCALTGQEYHLLLRGGYKPVGVAFGTCVYYNVATYGTQWASQCWSNLELTDYTQAVYIARHAAMTHLTEDAHRVSADGVVGVIIEKQIDTHEVEIQNNPPRTDLIVHFSALGTAIAASGSDTLAIDYNLPLANL